MTYLSAADVEELKQHAQYQIALGRGAKAVVTPEVLLRLLETFEDSIHIEAENERLLEELEEANDEIKRLEDLVEDLRYQLAAKDEGAAP